MNSASVITGGRTAASLRYSEALSVAAAFMHAGQDLMRGEPAALGIPAWLFAGGFFGYAILIASVNERSLGRLLLTGGVPIGIGIFHLIETHHGGFFMPVTYATILFGTSTIGISLIAERT